MSTDEHIHRFPDAAALAERVARDVLDRLVAVQRTGRAASVVLTGGSVARHVHRAMAADDRGLDWWGVDVWWGDERFLPRRDPDRNATQAFEDLLDRVDVHPGRVHEMPASDAADGDVESAASAYAHELRRAVESRGPGEPWFDVVMLGIGPDGHCASLFPGRPEVHGSGYVLPVHDSPKPPPTRLTMTLPVLRQATEVVFVATGSAKADAVAASVRGQDVDATPAAGPRGMTATSWYVDEDAAARL